MGKPTGSAESLPGVEETPKTSRKNPQSLHIAKNGVKTANDFARLMGALMSDIIEGAVTAEVGNAACKAGGNLLKVVEMQHKYGTSESQPDRKTLILAQ